MTAFSNACSGILAGTLLATPPTLARPGGALSLGEWTNRYLIIFQSPGVGKTIFVGTAPAQLPASSETGFAQRAEPVRRNLERLADGWSGPGSMAPTPSVLRDLDTALDAMPQSAGAPEVEVDEDSGHVTLRWSDAAGASSIAFIATGNGRIVAVKTTAHGPALAETYVFSAGHPDSIARYLANDDDIAKALLQA